MSSLLQKGDARTQPKDTCAKLAHHVAQLHRHRVQARSNILAISNPAHSTRRKGSKRCFARSERSTYGRPASWTAAQVALPHPQEIGILEHSPLYLARVGECNATQNSCTLRDAFFSAETASATPLLRTISWHYSTQLLKLVERNWHFTMHLS